MSVIVEEFASRLGARLPVLDDPSLARTLLRMLAMGKPVSTSALAADAKRVVADVQRTLDGWTNVRRDAEGRVTGFMGLSLEPTRHEFVADGRRHYAWCAWDTLFLPAVLQTTARVRSRCPLTGAAVRLVVTPTEVEGAEPRDLYVSFPSPAAVDAGDIVGSLCCHVLFLAGAQAGERWTAARPTAVVLMLSDAYRVGAIAIERLEPAA